MKRLRIQHLGPIHDVDVEFGDLTVLVGPQASGKSLFAQTVKAVEDIKIIRAELKNYGFNIADPAYFSFIAQIYFGGGLKNALARDVGITINGRGSVFGRHFLFPKRSRTEESVYLVPAQRALVLQDGWPRPFMSYPASDPYCIKHFSECIRLAMEASPAKSVLTRPGRGSSNLRTFLSNAIYVDGQLTIEVEDMRKRIVLRRSEDSAITVGAWSTGQREFTPLLIALQQLMPGAKRRKKGVRTVIIEEPELGLHPQAIVNFGLLVLELLVRGYQVIISTHSPVIVDLVWAMKELASVSKPKAHKALKKVFQLNALTQSLQVVLDAAIKKRYRVYHFERTPAGVVAKDISSLDPGSSDPNISGWGGLSGFSGDIADAVGEALS